MSAIPTVKIVKGDRYAIINESDFDPSRHVLYDPAPEPALIPQDAPAKRGRPRKNG